MEMLFSAIYTAMDYGVMFAVTIFLFAVVSLLLAATCVLTVYAFGIPTWYTLKFLHARYAVCRKIVILVEKESLEKKAFFTIVAICMLVSSPILVLGFSKSMDLFGAAKRQGQPEMVIENTEIEQFKLLSITAPKHVYVKIEHVKSGHEYYEYVSKHCSKTDNTLGAIYNIKVTTYHMSNDPSKKLWIFENLSGVFC